MITFADNFLAGSIISLLIPVTLLIAIVAWYVLSVRRVPSGRSPEPPPTTIPDPIGGGERTSGESGA